MAFVGLLALAVGLRLWAIFAYSPAVLSPAVHDAAQYINAAHFDIAGAAHEPAGYPILLRALHTLSHSLTFTIVVQHAMGIATGALLFLAVRQLDVPAWLGLIPAAVVWFNGDQLFLEHAPLSETFFEFVLAGMLYSGLRSLQGGVVWPAVAGALSACLLSIRSVAAALPIVVVAWIAFALIRSGVPWRRTTSVMLISALLVGGAYAAIKRNGTGQWSSVLADGSGWNLYARSAVFADCTRFRPPPGTAGLCQSTPPAERPGPSYYLWLGGPARAAYGAPPNHDALLGDFARAAILNQPLDYLRVVGTDLVRYVLPHTGADWPNDFAGVEALNFLSRGPMVDPPTRQQVDSYYGPFRAPSAASAAQLLDYQGVMRVTGPILLLLVLLGMAAGPLTRGATRRGVALLLAVAIELLLVPVLVLHTEWRYAVPALGPLAAAAGIGAWALAGRLAAARSRRRVGSQATKPRSDPTAIAPSP